jgi:hypothetical protein
LQQAIFCGIAMPSPDGVGVEQVLTVLRLAAIPGAYA